MDLNPITPAEKFKKLAFEANKENYDNERDHLIVFFNSIESKINRASGLGFYKVHINVVNIVSQNKIITLNHPVYEEMLGAYKKILFVAGYTIEMNGNEMIISWD